jgi:type I restriction enzyme, S subunit
MTQTELTQTVSLMGKWKPYPAYKDSGVEWLGEIPEQWEMKRLRFICQVNPSKTELSYLPIDTQISFLPMEHIGEDGSTSLEEIRTIEQVKQGYTCFRNGDVIVAKITPCFENGKGALCNQLLNGIGFGTTELHVLRAKEETDPNFIFYLTRSEPFREIGTAMMYGSAGQKRVPEDFISNFQVGFPPITEQRAIAAFLECETVKINALIVKKERLIELLQEKRAALISHAVTKGLDPTVPMKDSGVEWLGEIPVHWEARQFKRVAEISYGLTLELDRTETEGTYIISLPNVTKEGQLLLSDVPLTPLTFEEKKKLLLRKGDLLFNWRNGSSDHVGKTAYFDADGEYTHVSFLLRIRFDSTSYDSRYYQMFLNNLRNTKFFSSAKNRVNKTYNQTELGRLEVMVPPFEEQRTIATYLDRETAKIDELISRIHEGIEKLKEYSTALISATASGKIDVRNTNMDDNILE